MTAFAVAAVWVGSRPSAAATKPAAKPKAPTSRPVPRHQQIDHGPFVTATIPSQWAEHGITNKAIAVRLVGQRAPDRAGGGGGGGGGGGLFGQADPAAIGGVTFDTDACRFAAGWTGGFVEFTKDWTSVRDEKSVKIVGSQKLGTPPGPGWARPGAAGEDAWKDPRPRGFGPLPDDWVHYKGLYRHGDRVVFAYTVGGCDVLESPGLVASDGPLGVFTRSLRLGKSDVPLRLLACERTRWRLRLHSDDRAGLLPAGEEETGTTVVVRDLPHGARWLPVDQAGPGRLVLEIPAAATPCEFTLLSGDAAGEGAPAAVDTIFHQILDSALRVPRPDLTALTRGGPALWPQTIATAGKLGAGRGADDPYVVDTLTLPDDNPWKSWMRPGGFDFFTSDPTKAAVCNWSGDVWVVSGINADLKELKWRRIASGLFQPLGLRIVDDVIYVQGRDQVTRLRDLNGDGETDFYENFNNDVEVTPNFHEFAFDLQTDAAGNFYFAKAGPVRNGGQGFETIAAHHGSILKLSPDGKTLERYATGFRAPNGIGVGPDGQITCGDNEGTWVPKCRLAWVKPGGFYGVVDTAHRKPPPTDYDRPLCWMPKNVDNSSGGQVWVPAGGDKWGPFAGRLLHLSYGQCALYLVLKEDVNGQVQGGVVKFPLAFDSGIMRARFNPADGQLYVAGLKGWQTTAGKDGCFQRVRYTGKPVHMPTGLHATKGGLRITFTTPLAPAEANDVGNYDAERWNYVWSGSYGSPDVSADDPAKKTHDPVNVKSARLLPDGKSVLLEIADMKPVMQMKTAVNVSSAEGKEVRYEIYHTVHGLAADTE